VAGADAELDTRNPENDLEMNNEAEELHFHRMAKVDDYLEMRQGSQNLCATKKESHAQIKEMTIVGYILDTEEIVKASSSLFQHHGAAAFKLSERSPLPPALSAKDLTGGETQKINVRWIHRINHHPVGSDKVSAPENISATKDWLNWNTYLHNPNDTKDDCKADIESDIAQGNGIADAECLLQWDMSTAPNIPRLIRPIQKLNTQAEKVLVRVNAIETRRNKRGKNK
jgi:hypothetical protein